MIRAQIGDDFEGLKIVKKEDQSYRGTSRMTYRVLLNVSEKPNEQKIKDVALAIFYAMPSYYCFDFLEFLGPKLNEDEDFLDSIYHTTGSYIVSEYTVSEYDGSIDDFFEQYKSKEFISPRHLSRITEIIGPLELQTKSWKEQKEKDQERQTRIKEEAKKLKSSQSELF